MNSSGDLGDVCKVVAEDVIAHFECVASLNTMGPNNNRSDLDTNGSEQQ